MTAWTLLNCVTVANPFEGGLLILKTCLQNDNEEWMVQWYNHFDCLSQLMLLRNDPWNFGRTSSGISWTWQYHILIWAYGQYLILMVFLFWHSLPIKSRSNILVRYAQHDWEIPNDFDFLQCHRHFRFRLARPGPFSPRNLAWIWSGGDTEVLL